MSRTVFRNKVSVVHSVTEKASWVAMMYCCPTSIFSHPSNNPLWTIPQRAKIRYIACNMPVPEKFTKPYNPQATEGAIYKKWEDSGYFNPDNLPIRLDAHGKPAEMEPFVIIMPPPNANGSLHAGHAWFVTLQDIMVRFARMRG